MNRILLFVLGVLTVIGGIWCAATPGLTYLSMVWVAGVIMFFHAVEEILTYGKRKSMGVADGWNLVGAVIACICGFLIIISAKAELLTGVAMLYVLFTWLIIAGVLGILGSFKLKKHSNTGIQAIDNYTGKWWVGMLLGILMILGGCFGFAHPILSMISVGIIVSIDIISVGVNMLVRAFTAA